MVYLKTLIIKVLVTGVAVFSLFGIFHMANSMSLFAISLLTTALSFVIGDLFILRKFGNLVASIADFPLTFLALFFFGGFFIQTGTPMAMTAFLGAFFITFTEPFIHAYLTENLEEDTLSKQTMSPQSGQMQTEFAEELETDKLKDGEKHDHDNDN